MEKWGITGHGIAYAFYSYCLVHAFSFHCFDSVGWVTEGHLAYKKLVVFLLMVTI